MERKKRKKRISSLTRLTKLNLLGLSRAWGKGREKKRRRGRRGEGKFTRTGEVRTRVGGHALSPITPVALRMRKKRREKGGKKTISVSALLDCISYFLNARIDLRSEKKKREGKKKGREGGGKSTADQQCWAGRCSLSSLSSWKEERKRKKEKESYLPLGVSALFVCLRCFRQGEGGRSRREELLERCAKSARRAEILPFLSSSQLLDEKEKGGR